MSSTKLERLKDDLASRRTKAFLVVRNDRIVYEWYADGHGASKTHYTASMAKALVGGLSLAVALTDGGLALDDPRRQVHRRSGRRSAKGDDHPPSPRLAHVRDRRCRG